MNFRYLIVKCNFENLEQLFIRIYISSFIGSLAVLSCEQYCALHDVTSMLKYFYWKIASRGVFLMQAGGTADWYFESVITSLLISSHNLHNLYLLILSHILFSWHNLDTKSTNNWKKSAWIILQIIVKLEREKQYQ